MTLDELKKIAEAATPGPWKTYMAPQLFRVSRFTQALLDGEEICDMSYISIRNKKASYNADFIATFSPSTILQLLDRLRKAEQVLSYYAELPTKDQCNFGHTEVCGDGGPAQTALAELRKEIE